MLSSVDTGSDRLARTFLSHSSTFVMSSHILPLLFLNLGGEMVYILNQRLSAQKIKNEKAKQEEPGRKTLTNGDHRYSKLTAITIRR
ncbi:hypothetical protein M8J77_003703 [Diaphorina citri]|nr:hypothetical protein M8J77_003703 [Diaphorina citri]